MPGLVESVEETTYVIQIPNCSQRQARLSSSLFERPDSLSYPYEHDSAAVRAAWEKGLEDVTTYLNWQKPNSYVNFSRSGLQMLHTDSCCGNRALVALESNLNHRLSGMVVRVDEINEAMQNEVSIHYSKTANDTHAIAIRFQAVNQQVEEAFSRATVEQQIREFHFAKVMSKPAVTMAKLANRTWNSGRGTRV